MIPLIVKEYLTNKNQKFLVLCELLHKNIVWVWKTRGEPRIPLKIYIKHVAIGSLISASVTLGSTETYHWYYGKSNLTGISANHNNHTWLANVYLNIPFNEPEYKNLTNLLNLPQSCQVQKVNDILFSGLKDNSLDWENELARLKINDLAAQIPSKKRELEKLITKVKNKFNKAENYLLAQLLDEKSNSEKLNELRAALSDHKDEIEFILTKRQELRDLTKHLERLQNSQLETKIEIINY